MNAASRVVVLRVGLRLVAQSFALLLFLPATLWGVTWSPDERLTNDPSNSAAPTIAADLSGNLHVVWHDERDENSEIYYRRWSSGIWSNEERLTFDNATSAWPVIASDRLGRAHVVWYDYRLGSDHPQIFCKHWDGLSWSTDELVSQGKGWAVVPTVIADPLGNIHAIWYDNRNEEDWEIYHRRWDGQSWGPEDRLTESQGESRYPAAIADEIGNLYVVWQDRRDGNWEIYLKRWDGLAWGPDQRLTAESHNSLRPAIAADVLGNVWIAWYDSRDGHSEIYYKRYDGVSWTPDTRLSDADAFASIEPTIAADRMGHVYVAWQDDRDGASELYFRAWDGISWSVDERVTNDPAFSSYPALTVDPLGAAQLVWQDTRDANSEIYRKERSAPEPPGPPPIVEGASPPIVSNFGTREVTVLGNHFGVPAVVKLLPEIGPPLVGTTVQVTATTVVARFDMTDVPVGWLAAVVANGAGQADTLGNCIQVIQGPWGQETRLTTNSGVSSLASNGGRAMVRDSSGRLHLFWLDSRDGNQEIYTKTREDENWSADERLTEDTGQSLNPVTALSGDGTVVVIWQDTRDGNAEIYSKSLNGGVWTADTRLTSNAAPSLYPSVARDPSGNLHLVWQDGRTGAYQVFYSRMSNGVWSDPVRITQTIAPAVYPTVDCDSQGRVYVAWTDGRDNNWEIYFTRFAEGAWETERRVTFDMMTSAYPSMATDGEAAYLVWQDQRNGREEVFFRRLDTEDTDHRLVSDQGDSKSPMLAVTEDHEIHIVWSDTRTGLEQIWYKVFNPTDGAWSLEHRMTGSSQEAVLPSILAGPENSVDVVWRDSRDESTEVYSRTRREILPAETNGPWAAGDLSTIRCMPNPFRDSMVLGFRLAMEQQVMIQIFDVQGRRIRTLHDGRLGAGSHEIRWDGFGDGRRDPGPGVYYYRLVVDRRSESGPAVRLP